MKKILILSLLLLPNFSFAASLSDYSVFAHWTLDEHSGIREDSSTNNYHLTNNSSVGWATGLRNDSSDYTNSNQSLTYTSGLSGFSGSSMSVGVSINADNFTGNPRIWYLDATYDATLVIAQTGSIPSCQIQTASGWNYAYGSALTTTTWYHILCVYTGSQADIYVNGSLDTQSRTTSGGSFAATSYNLYVSNASNGLADFIGSIDELSLFASSEAANASAIYNSAALLPFEIPAPDVNYCVYATITDMNNISGMTCSTDGATTTCSYATTTQSVPVQVTSGDILFGLSLIFFILAIFFIGFVINPFKTTWKK